jgi:anaerobic dimethyl sulfoxide reductase subunit B (iron-sulfur subunit)
MNKGFIFRKDYCTGCSACIAACGLENGWERNVRTIYRHNSRISPDLSVFNLSLACNHCTTAVCMEGCPSGAYSRDMNTGAVIIDANKCLGCSYCRWNCPYDAPKMRKTEKTILKCNFCNELIATGGIPVCASACPTGALGFDALGDEAGSMTFPDWLPDKSLEPRLYLHPGKPELPLEVIPARHFHYEAAPSDQGKSKRNISGEWSLIAFSYLLMLSVAIQLDYLFTGEFISLPGIILLTLLPGLISVFHLGLISRAWRVLYNVKSSALSREIFLYLIYIILTGFSLVYRSAGIALTASLAGIILLLAIDSVYSYSSSESWFSSGATFISGLLVASFFAGLLIPFLFIALLKLIILIRALVSKNQYSAGFQLRFVRTALLILTVTALISGINTEPGIIFFIFLAGELADRVLFYIDFEPLSINNTLKT